MIAEHGENLVFLLSLPRSGSTLLSLLLGGHSRILCPPEPWFLLKISSFIQSRSADTLYDDELATEGTNAFLDDATFLSAARAFASTAYNDHLKAVGKVMFVDKTPRYSHVLPFIDHLFPRARKIWLKRHPLEVALSYKTTWNLSIEELAGSRRTTYSADFTDGLFKLAAYFDVPSPYKYALSYEALVSFPRQSLVDLCRFLEVPFEERMLDYSKNSELLAQHAASVMGDKKALATQAPHRNSIKRWLTCLSSVEIQRLVDCLGIGIFHRMGYPKTDDALRQLGVHLPAEADAAAFRQQLSNAPIDKIEELRMQLTSVHDQLRELNRELEISEADRAARLQDVQRLTSLLKESEADRAARLQDVQRLTSLLKESEADRAARLQVIHGITGHLKDSEADRATQRKDLQRLRAQLQELEADRAARLRDSERMSVQLKESEADRARQLEAERAQQRLQQENEVELHRLRRALDSAQTAALRLRATRPYRLLRRVGLWGWLEPLLSQALGDPAAAPVSGKQSTSASAQRRRGSDKARTVAIDLTPLLPGAENGGAKIVATALVQEMSRIAPDHDFILLTSGRSHEELVRLDADNVHRIAVDHSLAGDPNSSWTSRLIRSLASLLGITSDGHYSMPIQELGNTSLLGRIGADVLFCPFAAPRFYHPAVPMVSVVNDTQSLDYPQFFDSQDRRHRDNSFLNACRLATTLVCISDYVRARVLEHGAVSPQRVVTTHYRLSNRLTAQSSVTVYQELEKYDLKLGRFLLYPANFWPHKNHRMLITAFGIYRNRHRDSDLKLVCTGAPNTAMEHLRDASTQVGLRPWVVFPGFLPEERFAALLQSCFALIFPSLYEGLGMPVLEAMAFGKPVLCSNVTSLPEIAGGAALLFDPRKPTEIASAIEHLERDSTASHDLVARGYRRVAAFEDASVMARQYLEVFAEALSVSPTLTPAIHGVYPDGWTNDRVVLTFDASQEARHVEFTLRTPSSLPSRRTSVEVIQNGRVSQRRQIRRGDVVMIRHTIPSGSGFLEFRINPVFQPKAHGSSNDERFLGCLCEACRIVSGNATVDLLESNILQA